MNSTNKPRGNLSGCKKGLYGVLLMGMLVTASCAHYEPRYTPDTVAPPPSLDAALARINKEATAAPTQNASMTAPTPPANPVLNITLEEAIRTALQRNRALEVQSYSPEIAEKAIDEARAAFDPRLTVSTDYSNQKTPGVTVTNTTGSQTNIGTAAGTPGEALAVFQTLLQETQKITRVLQAQETTVNSANNFSANANLSQPLPTGTQLYFESGYGRNDTSQTDAQYAGALTLGVSQALLRGFGSDVNLVSLRTARNNAAISELAFRDFMLQLVSQVEAAYWELALAQETLRIQELALDLAQEQLKLNEAMIAVGKLSGTARISAVAEVASQKASLVNAQADLMKRSITLWRLLNPDAQTPESLQFLSITLPEITEPPPVSGESVALAKYFRPDLAQARLDVANGELAVLQTKNGLLPRLDAFASYGANSSGAGSGDWSTHLDDDTYGAFQTGLTLSVTLGNRAEKARYQRAKLQQGQAEAAIRNLEQNIEAEVRQAVLEVSRQTEQVTASQQEVRSRQEELAVETEQFRLGRSTNLNVLQVQQKLIQAKVQEATAQVRYRQALTALYQFDGTLLTRHGIVTDREKDV